MLPEDIVKGASITQTRVKDWWAKDRKYYRYRFNPDKLVHTVVRDESKAFELFRAGELDTFFLTQPQLWYEKSEIEPVYKGYIERVTFYNRYPKVPRGLYLNVSKPPLDDRNVRIGIQHAMNWQKVIDVMFRGDYQRLNAFNEGYVIFSDPSIVARPFSIDAARAAFAQGRLHPGGTRRHPDQARRHPALGRRHLSGDAADRPDLRHPARGGESLRIRAAARRAGIHRRLQKGNAETARDGARQLADQPAGAGFPSVPPFHQRHRREGQSQAADQQHLRLAPRRIPTCSARKSAPRSTADELKDAAWKLQRIMHDEAIFVPGYSVDFVRIGSWRWVRWPDCETTRFSPPVVYDPHEVFVFWIDEEVEEGNPWPPAAPASPSAESTRTVEDYRRRNPHQRPPKTP